MTAISLYITHKKYSSWSLRIWLLMRHLDIPFTEIMVPMSDTATVPAMRSISGTAKVPCLIVDQPSESLVLWESLAIIEYLAETYGERQIWPSDASKRAVARVVSAEMHAGFVALRSACPMNLFRVATPLSVDAVVRADVGRVLDIWRELYAQNKGPFLFGAFSAADAMFAPVYTRIKSYQLSDDPIVDRFGAALESMPAWQQWVAEAAQETNVVAANEIP